MIQVAAGDAQVTVSWAPVAGAASYNLYYATAPGVTPANYPSWPGGTRIVGAASPQVVTGLTNGTTYYVVGTAVYPAGESEKSAEVQATPNATNTACPVVINEVMFYPDPASTEPIRTHEWVELFNPGPDCNIAGWIISNRDASADALLPNWIFPANSYLVVHFTTGTNDNDFSDAEGDFYAGNADVFSDVMDECALYTGAPGSGTIRDFIAWTRDETITFTGGTAHGHAVSAAMWTAGDYLDAASAGTSDEEKIQSLFAGVTIGRDKDSHDSNLSGDWGIDGGPDAIDMTPGALNFSPMGIAIGPPEPTNGLKANKKWTFMVYLDGDNDLEKYAFDDLNEMERVGSDANVNIVVEFDSWNKAHEVVLQDGKW
ncbi:MAG: lamin tail domain-containing protein, partial [candidate division Zixibacteria bacterium]|nr:lamin tail domain-containing protein [candidate division Zixibacteria bacterium]